MNKLNEILHELGISKVKLSKFLGVSRQMIYNYLELDDINKWPKDKKVLLLNLLGVKSASEIEKLKVDTDYIMEVEARLNSISEEVTENTSNKEENREVVDNLGTKQQELLSDINDILKEKLDDDKDSEAFYMVKYLYHFLQSIDTSRELKYMLGYVAKAAGFVKADEFVFNKEEQFDFEGVLFSAMTLYNDGMSNPRIKPRIAESHRRFVAQIEHKMEEKISRTLELNTLKVQAMKELGYSKINEENAAEVLEKIAEIQSRNVIN